MNTTTTRLVTLGLKRGVKRTTLSCCSHACRITGACVAINAACERQAERRLSFSSLSARSPSQGRTNHLHKRFFSFARHFLSLARHHLPHSLLRDTRASFILVWRNNSLIASHRALPLAHINRLNTPRDTSYTVETTQGCWDAYGQTGADYACVTPFHTRCAACN